MKIVFFNLLRIFVYGFVFGGCARPNYAPAGSEGTQSRTSRFCFQTQPICVEAMTPPSPLPLKEKFAIEYRFSQSGLHGSRVFVDPPGELRVIPWMPDMGHGSIPVTITHPSFGIYVIQDIYFLMPGTWTILLQIKEGNDVIDQITYTYQL